MNIEKMLKPGLLALLLAAGLGLTSAMAQTPKPVEPVDLAAVRGMRFCEFILVFDEYVDIYNTSASPDGCPTEIWDTLDPAAIAAEHGAQAARLNGPKFWAMDAQTAGFGEAGTFGGIEARYAATLPLAALGSGKGADPYAPYTTQKSQQMLFRAGSPVFELVDPDGNVYVMNAYGDRVTNGDPANLSSQLTVADGWTFRVRVLDEDLTIVQEIDTPSQMVGDDFEQYYSMISGDLD